MDWGGGDRMMKQCHPISLVQMMACCLGAPSHYLNKCGGNRMMKRCHPFTVMSHDHHWVWNQWQPNCSKTCSANNKGVIIVCITGPLFGEFTGDCGFTLIKGQWFGKCFHALTSCLQYGATLVARLLPSWIILHSDKDTMCTSCNWWISMWTEVLDITWEMEYFSSLILFWNICKFVKRRHYF